MNEREASDGVVKFWREEKGWGAISSADLPAGRDAWAHFSVIDMEGYRSLTEGQRVEFRYHPARQDSFDFVADWVKPLG
jgi:CspA family cold shock protein